LPNVADLKEKMAKDYAENLNEMKKQVEKECSERYEQKSRELKEINGEIAFQNQELHEELGKYESERRIIPILKVRIDELENALKIFQSSDIDSFRKESEAKDNIITSKNSEIERLNGIIEGNKSKIINAEQLIDGNQEMKMELLELRSEKDNTIKALEDEARELKWIKDTLMKNIDNILMMDSVMNIKPALARLKDEAIRKIDYELQKQADMLI